jgi:hypothetical protein
MKKPALIALVLAASCARGSVVAPVPPVGDAAERPQNGNVCTFTPFRLPLPAGTTLYGVATIHDYSSSSSSSGYDVPAFIVGYSVNGTSKVAALALRFEDRKWKLQPIDGPSAQANELYGVDALSAVDAWAVGQYLNGHGVLQPLIEHWDGKGWSYVPSPSAGKYGGTLSEVNAIDPTDVYAVGTRFASGYTFEGLIYRWDGKRWTDQHDTYRPAFTSNYNFSTAPESLRGSGLQLMTVDADVLKLHVQIGEMGTRTGDGAQWIMHDLLRPKGVKDTYLDKAAPWGKSGNVLAVGAYDTPGATIASGMSQWWNGKSFTWQMLPKAGAGSSLIDLAYSNDLGGALAVGWYAENKRKEFPWALDFNGVKWSALRLPKIGYGSYSAIAPIAGSHDFWAIGNTYTLPTFHSQGFVERATCSKF